MPVIQSILNMDQHYHRTPVKMLVNDFDRYDKDDVESIVDKVVTKYTDDLVSLEPKCFCGETKGEGRIGKICEYCKNPVEEVFTDKYPTLWYKRLPGMPKFISPIFWMDASRALSTSVDVMRWLSDSSYCTSEKDRKNLPDFVRTIEVMKGFTRSYSYLVDNMENILTFYSNVSSFKNTPKQEKLLGLIKLWKEEKNNLLSEYMPVVSKHSIVVEETHMGNFTDTIVGEILNTALIFLKACYDNPNVRRKENVMARTIHGISMVGIDRIADVLASKRGYFRADVFASRLPGMRATISSLRGIHNYDEVWLPYSPSVVAFRPLIINILIRNGIDPHKARWMATEGVKRFIPEVGDALDTILAEGFDPRGYPIILQRNPSLMQWSALRLFAKFKKDPKDYTIDMSVLLAKLIAGDFDGDQCNIILLYSKSLAELADTLAPKYAVPDSSGVFEISGRLSMTNAPEATLSEYIRKADRTPINIEATKQLLDSLRDQ